MPLLLAIVAAYFQWGVFGLPAIPPGAQPPAAGRPQGFPGWLRITHYVKFLFLTLLIRSGLQILRTIPRFNGTVIARRTRMPISSRHE